MGPCSRPSEEVQIPVPAISSRLVHDHHFDFVIIQVLNTASFTHHI